MKIQIMTSETCHTEVEVSQITSHFVLHDTFDKGRRNFKIDHLQTGRTICRRNFASPEVAESLCQSFEDAFGNALDSNVVGSLKEDMTQNTTYQKYYAYRVSLLLEDQENPINFTKLAKARKMAMKELGY